MNKLIIVCLLLLTVMTGYSQTRKSKAKDEPAAETPAQQPVIRWEATTYDFGQLIQGQKTTVSFNFMNTGTAPLVISNVQTTCGCTASDWSRKPVLPNTTGKVTVTFNSAGKIGRQNKVITVISNAAKAEDQLILSGTVLPDTTKR